MIATELVLLSEDHVYSFLGGALTRGIPAPGIGDLLKHELFLWARRMGKRAFILGGGYARTMGSIDSRSPSLPGASVPFNVGTAVHDSAALHDLMSVGVSGRDRGVAWEPVSDFLPRYRA